jgi:quinoprotein glucose dehydrogenase
VVSNPDSGAVLRCNPDGSELEIFATGLRNPQELAFNEFGDLFTVDNNSDAGDRARLVHIVEGMDAGWRMSYQYLPDRGPFNREKIWHTQNDEQPASIIPPLAHVTEGPSGLVQYPGTGLPAEHTGAFLVCDFHGAAGTSGLLEFWVERAGATYRLAREQVFAEGVLATDCEFGPDGALYVSDWIEGWDGTGKGRIHRIASEDETLMGHRAATQAMLTRIPRLPPDELVGAIGHADMRVRLAAQRRLAAIGPAVATQLLQTARSPKAPLLGRLHAIWTLGQLSEQKTELLLRLIELSNDDEPEVRVQVARMLGRGRDAVDNVLQRACSEQLAAMLGDESPRVRSSAAIALGGFRCPETLPPLLNLARDHALEDPTLRHAAAVGMAGTQTPDELINAAESAGEAERLAIVVALGRQKSTRVAELLDDPSIRVRTEAARVIWDVPLPGAYGPLAAALDGTPSSNEPMLRRAIAANLALRSASHLTSVIRCGLRDDLSSTMRDHVWQLVSDWGSPSPRDPVHGLWRPLEPQLADVVAATLNDALPVMMEAGAHGAMGLVVAAELGIANAHEAVARIVGDEQFAPDIRARAVSALGAAPEPIALDALNTAMQSAESSIRATALQLMVQRFPDRAVGEVIEVAESGAIRERQSAITMLPKLKAPAALDALRGWIDRLEQSECPPEFQLEVIEAAHQTSDPESMRRIQAFEQQRLASGDVVEQFAASLHGGDAEAGRRIFEENASLACRRCHSMQPGQTLVGPSLADAGLKLSREELLLSIVKPNDKIAEGFKTTVLQLETGKVVSGILRSEDNERMVLVDADGKEAVVSRAEIVDTFEGISAMPEELAKQITAHDLRDLIEWLSQQRAVADEPAHGEVLGSHAQ